VRINIKGPDGNVFAMLGICGNALKRVHRHEDNTEMVKRCFAAKSYTEALAIMGEYVDLEV
jgi:hypothetical protein